MTLSSHLDRRRAYGEDNRCLLDAIARSAERFKGVAVVAHDTGTAALADLKGRGIVGIAVNVTFHGLDYYADIGPLIRRLTDLDMFLQIQVEGDQLLGLMPLLDGTEVRILVDHCGRPDLAYGLDQPGFRTLLALADTGRATVKLSGLAKFARTPPPYADTWPYVRALVAAYGLDACVWGSDWPFLRAPERVDYGPLLTVVDRLFPNPADRERLLWRTPARLFGFTGAAEPSAPA